MKGNCMYPDNYCYNCPDKGECETQAKEKADIIKSIKAIEEVVSMLQMKLTTMQRDWLVIKEQLKDKGIDCSGYDEGLDEEDKNVE